MHFGPSFFSFYCSLQLNIQAKVLQYRTIFPRLLVLGYWTTVDSIINNDHCVMKNGSTYFLNTVASREIELTHTQTHTHTHTHTHRYVFLDFDVTLEYSTLFTANFLPCTKMKEGGEANPGVLGALTISGSYPAANVLKQKRRSLLAWSHSSTPAKKWFLSQHLAEGGV